MSTVNRTEYAILGLLAMGPKSGYDVKKAVEGTLRHFWSESFGQIYPVLRRLHERGWADCRPQDSGPTRARQVYSLTEAGRAALGAWLREPVERVPPRNELLLKMFFGQFADPSAVHDHVLRFGEQQRDALRVLESVRREVRGAAAAGPALEYWLLTIDLGIRSIQATIAWADAALPQVAELAEEHS